MEVGIYLFQYPDRIIVLDLQSVLSLSKNANSLILGNGYLPYGKRSMLLKKISEGLDKNKYRRFVVTLEASAVHYASKSVREILIPNLHLFERSLIAVEKDAAKNGFMASCSSLELFSWMQIEIDRMNEAGNYNFSQDFYALACQKAVKNFGSVSLPLNEFFETELEMDPYDFDATICAWFSVGGRRINESCSEVDIEKRRKFWIWYLDEGIPKSYESVLTS